MPVRVLVDASCLTDVDSATRGFGRYVNALLESAPLMPSIDLHALASTSAALPAGVRRVTLHRRATSRLVFPEHVVRLSRDIARFDGAVFHQPTAEPPIRSNRPYVQTLHDVIPLVFPGFEAERRRWRYRGWAMRRADLVIAITRWSADLAISHLRIAPERVRVVLHGVNPCFTPAGEAPTGEHPYFLYVGEYGPHKGMAEAAAAVAQLHELGYPHRLRIIGNVNAYARPHLDRLLAANPAVEHVGRVTDTELAGQYRSATALLFTSRCEGFGRPPIEAMACATPVVAFANTSIPEVIGDGGVLVADGDVTALADAARKLADSPSYHHEVAEAGRRRAIEAFEWERCALETAAVYREAAERA